jgi:hypothetical protein
LCDPNDTPEKLWNDLQNAKFGASELHATIDGAAVENLDPATTQYRACASPVARCSAASFSVCPQTTALACRQVRMHRQWRTGSTC